MIYFTSDNHFYHKNIAHLQQPTRGNYATIEELHLAMIDKWKNDDLVYIIGDFCFGSTTQTDYILKKLNDTKILVVGNHGQKSKKSALFESVQDYLEEKYTDNML